MTNKCVAILCMFLLIWSPAVVYAESPPAPEDPKVNISSVNLGKVSQLRKGQHAPFAGILLSEEAAARLFADIKFSEIIELKHKICMRDNLKAEKRMFK